LVLGSFTGIRYHPADMDHDSGTYAPLHCLSAHFVFYLGMGIDPANLDPKGTPVYHASDAIQEIRKEISMSHGSFILEHCLLGLGNRGCNLHDAGKIDERTRMEPHIQKRLFS
jgi:hypothetical protein